MVRRKEIRKRGKVPFSRFFQKFSDGDSVAVVREKSLNASFPERLQGRTGVVLGKRGRAYLLEIKDQTKPKQFLIQPIHLKKIKRIEKSE